jgi:glycosyltransferase involved in cell wall biosynthesis
LRIASLTNTILDPALGSGKTVLAWSNGLRNLGHSVDVFSPPDYYRPWPRELAKRLKMRLDAARLARTILNGSYELVEFYGAEFGPLIHRLARHRGKPLLVAHTNGLELLAKEAAAPANNGSGAPGGLRRIAATMANCWIDHADRWAFADADAFAAICASDEEYIVRERLQPAARCATVEPGLDEAFLQAPWDRPKAHRIACLGTWTARKDPETLAAAAVYVMERDPLVEFHVLGAGGDRASVLAHLPASLHGRTVVHPRLSQAEVVEVLSLAKVFLFPSLYEGFGMAITEAMACGCAVAVTATGFGASIRDGHDGLVCPFRAPQRFGAAAMRLLGDDGFRGELATRGRARVMGLSWSRQVRKLEAVYQQWLRAVPN